ncbi:MAG: YfgM family protein [Succinivibrio sp.]
MDVLTDDHEREEVVRKWWHENWKPIALGVAIALAGLVGFRQYQSYKLHDSQEQAYQMYTLQNRVAAGDAKAEADARAFMDSHKDVYGALLALDLAASQARAGKFADAADNARFAALNGGDLISPQANLNLARILAQDGKADDALKALDSVKSDAYKAPKAEIRGDILLKKGDRDGAREAYRESARILVQAGMQPNGLLQMKLDSVAKEGDKPAFETARAAATAADAGGEGK